MILKITPDNHTFLYDFAKKLCISPISLRPLVPTFPYICRESFFDLYRPWEDVNTYNDGSPNVILPYVSPAILV